MHRGSAASLRGVYSSLHRCTALQPDALNLKTELPRRRLTFSNAATEFKAGRMSHTAGRQHWPFDAPVIPS